MLNEWTLTCHKPRTSPLSHERTFLRQSTRMLVQRLSNLLLIFSPITGGRHLVDIIGDISWTLLVTFRGHFCPREVLFLGDISWTFLGDSLWKFFG